MLHYNPRHVSSINMSIFRRTYCIITASGIVILCKRLYSKPVDSKLYLLSTGILYMPYILNSNPHPFYSFIHTYRAYCTYRIFSNLIRTLFTVSYIHTYRAYCTYRIFSNLIRTLFTVSDAD